MVNLIEDFFDTEQTASDGYGFLSGFQGVEANIIIISKDFDGEAHIAAARAIPIHIQRFTVFKGNEFDIAASNIQDGEVLVGDNLECSLGECNQFIDIDFRMGFTRVACTHIEGSIFIFDEGFGGYNG